MTLIIFEKKLLVSNFTTRVQQNKMQKQKKNLPPNSITKVEQKETFRTMQTQNVVDKV